MMKVNHDVRSMNSDDAIYISDLMCELGYSAAPEEIIHRYEALMKWPFELMLVAVVEGRVVGFCHVSGVKNFASSGYGEILELVVKAENRRNGIGSDLIKKASEWVLLSGFDRVRLRSGVHRTDAHKFYEKLGFSKEKASFAFEIKFPYG